MIQEFLVISPRGDTLITKKVVSAGISQRSTADLFLRHVNKERAEGSVPPIFLLEGITFCHQQHNQLYFVFTATKNVQAATLVELLQRLSRVFKDYLGVLTEESVRRNFLLLYELLDEVFDCGCPQGTSTELLKAYVYNEPVAVGSGSGTAKAGSSMGMMGEKLDKLSLVLADKVQIGEKKTMASAAANKPITVGTERKDNTVFVDVFEKLTVVLDRHGTVAHSYINGSIVLKSFMTGSPEMRLGLSDGVSISSLGVTGSGMSDGRATLTIDDVNLHECVRWQEGSKTPTFTFFAPDGEFTLLKYRIRSTFRPPITVQPILETQGTNGLDYVLRLRAEFPSDKVATNASVVFQLPAWATSVSVETAASPHSLDSKGVQISAGRADLDRKTQTVTWLIPKLPGGSELIVRAKIVLSSAHHTAESDLSQFGIVRVNFELPMHVLSGLQIKSLDFLHGVKPPNKWIRYVTRAQSYVGRW
eukprot:CAMPEP_0180148222 /NCGR_PEP_ID=MMETSP0986-20121125/19839_1 /TAXON_ID=697907 /ORGANISM="non described non described, Strain CCMP2293" /LENGTH=475 /DNA_ID=CAMNT_0022094153 /DNA_START=103 /DNA_END=1527 /DNA_ORIENTATION=-